MSYLIHHSLRVVCLVKIVSDFNSIIPRGEGVPFVRHRQFSSQFHLLCKIYTQAIDDFLQISDT